MTVQGMQGSNFLPHLQSLQWDVSHPSSVKGIEFFATPSLSVLTLKFSNKFHALLSIRTLRGRLQNIQEFSILLPHQTHVNVFDVTLSDLLYGMPRLSSVALPPFSLSPPIIKSLMSLSGLKKVVHSDPLVSAYDYDAYGCQLHFDTDGLSELESLNIYIDIQRGSEILQGHYAPRKLNYLYVGTRQFIKGHQLGSFLEVLVTTNRFITSLRLVLYAQELDRDPNIIKFVHICSLLKLDLNLLIIKHDNPLQYSNKDVVLMGKAWPHITYLSLNSEPLTNINYAPHGFPITSLHSFASYFPRLEKLGLYISVDEDFLTQPQRVEFQRLRYLYVGTSPLYSRYAEDIAIFLAGLIPNGQLDAEWLSGMYPPRTTHGVTRNRNWDHAIHLFRICSRAQRNIRREYSELLDQEKRRIDSLHAENSALKQEVIRLKTHLRGGNQSVHS
ncbi:hypothetical protein FRC02_008411 [Tulasnella sp. 418]|nr:hypothetical protein FRC02_008411 [Tulasnella sp. 418]